MCKYVYSCPLKFTRITSSLDFLSSLFAVGVTLDFGGNTDLLSDKHQLMIVPVVLQKL